MESLEHLRFGIKTTKNVPEASKPILEAAKKVYRFDPDPLKLMANYPALLNAYWEGEYFLSKTQIDAPFRKNI